MVSAILIMAALSGPAIPQVPFRGIVIDRESNTALSGATLGVRETREVTVSDANGRFTLSLQPGRGYTIQAAMPGYRTRNVPVGAERAAETMRIFLEKDVFGGGEILVTAKRDKQSTSRQTLGREELQRMPGSAGDLMRGIQSLPGVSTGSDVSGELFVRGNGPYENRILVDRFWLARAYHFGGFVSNINTDMIESIDFYSGGFPVMYGEALGSVLDIQTREKLEPTWGGKLNINLLTADAVIETPFTDNGYFIFSARRSYFDLYAKKFVQEIAEVEITVLPVFWDYQAKLGYHFSRENRVEFLAYGSSDRIALTIGDTEENDVDFVNRGVNYDTTGFGEGFTWRFMPSKRVKSVFKAGAYSESERFFFGEYLNVDVKISGAMLREDLSVQVSKHVDLDAGAEYIYARVDLDALAPVAKAGAPAPPNFPDDYEFKVLKIEGLHYRHLGGYLQAALTAGPVKWTAGLRGDMHEDFGKYYYLSPRSSVEVTVLDKNKISFATGLYQQAHDLYFTNDTFGNPSLSTKKAVHYIAACSREMDAGTTVTVESYYKKLWDLIVSGGERVFDDTGTGRIYGGEVLVRRALADGFFGWFSYGYSVSTRDDGDDKGEYPFEYDRTHIVNIMASYRPLRWLQVGVKWRYATGLPFTGIVGSYEDTAQGEHFPVYSKDFNGERLPAYHKLDIRFDFFTGWFGAKWDIYLELMNSYNSRNIYQKEFNQRQPYSSSNPKDVRDLPILPYLGVEVRF